MDLMQLMREMAPSFGFGGGAGMVVGFTAKRLTKLIALALGGTFMVMQLLSYSGWVHVDWYAVEQGTTSLLSGPNGSTILDRLWAGMTANLPFAGAFAAGFVVGFRAG